MPPLGERERETIVRTGRTVNVIVFGIGDSSNGQNNEVAYFRLPEAGGYEGIIEDVERDIKIGKLTIHEGSTLTEITRGTMKGNDGKIVFEKEETLKI
jgi:hypothetical protein